MVMLANYGRLSLAQVLAPAMEMAQGYPIERQAADSIERAKEVIRKWDTSRQVFLVHEGEEREAPHPGEIFRQPDLYRTLARLVEAEQEALDAGMGRREAILEAYKRFYQGDIAEDFVAGSQALGGLHTLDDLANWQVHIEQPVHTTYRDIDVYKLTTWVQGPVMLQALNMAELVNWPALGFNSAHYVHRLYQIMNLAYADRDFYYGDPYFPPEEPIQGLLSKKYAAARLEGVDLERNDPAIKPGDPYRYQRGSNPYLDYLQEWTNTPHFSDGIMPPWQQAGVDWDVFEQNFLKGTTSVAGGGQGRLGGIGHTLRRLDTRRHRRDLRHWHEFSACKASYSTNVRIRTTWWHPGKRPRATLTPGMALKDGKPYLSFAVQGGDIQDQVLLQMFLGMVEFGMNVQEAVEAPYFISYQMRNSFADHRAEPGKDSAQ